MREPGRVFTRTELCERVWAREHEYDTKLVEVFVGRLRKKLGTPLLIHTVRHRLQSLGMKRWPLRWKIALYAASLGIIATIAGAGTTWSLMHFAEMRAFDSRLRAEGEEMLRQLRRAPDAELRELRWLEPSRLVDLRDARGDIRYRSPGADFGAGRPTSARNLTLRARRYRVLTVAADDLHLTIAGDLAEINTIGRDIIFGMFGAIPTVLLVVLLGGRWVAQRALGPVEKIERAAAQITPRNLDQRLPMPEAHDEIAALVSVLNRTFDRLQRSFEQSIRFSADASHHLKTPVAVLRAGVEEMLRDPETPPAQLRRADALLHQTHQLASIAENLLLLARADAGRLELKATTFDFSEILDGVRDDLQALAEPEGIVVETEIPRPLMIHGDRFAISLLLQNLVDNAVKYNRRGGRVRIAARRENGRRSSLSALRAVAARRSRARALA